MSRLSLSGVSFSWSGSPLLDEVDLEIGAGERIGLLGRNGCGKSTLMKLLAGEIQPDEGRVRRAAGVRVARLVQEVPQGFAGNVSDIVAQGVTSTDGEEFEDWKVEQLVKRVLSRMTLDGDAEFDTLSSGMKRRVLLAQALVEEPDVLLLDEPTNHLDIESIGWLEKFLSSYAGTLVFVTHDRIFLQALADRIVEIDRGRLFDWTCGYSTFLERKRAALNAEEKQNKHFDRRLAQEEVWIRQGIKARRTRNEGRVRALKAMRDERHQRRERQGNVHMRASEAAKSGRLVIEAEELRFAYDEQPIIRDFSTLISRGDKIGIIGPNGSGKTTLLKLLLGQLEPDAGEIRHGARLEVVYFDQRREQIDDEMTVAENVGEGEETFLIDGRKKHILGYLQDFLFAPERARQKAKFLSGGERNRLLLARIFKRPSNVLVMDEPTNDLDTETLELLEELVTNYTGTLLLVSHDRAFLNNVVGSTLAVEGDGTVKEYDGGYDDYLRQRQQASTEDEPAKRNAETPTGPSAKRPAKLSYKEQREVETLPKQIEDLEQQQEDLHAAMGEPEFFKQGAARVTEASGRLESIQSELGVLYARWEELER
jgi:ATP-binding cassette subfamily F protein uup